MFVFFALYHILRGLVVPRLVLVTENLALRQRLLVLHRSSNRPRLRHRDRLFWIALSQLWRDWGSILVIVKPETVIKWHGKASSAIGAGSPELVESDAPGLTLRFAILLAEYPVRIRDGECRGSKQNFTCLAMRLQTQLWRSIDPEVVSHLRKHGRAFFGIMLARSPQSISSPCRL